MFSVPAPERVRPRLFGIKDRDCFAHIFNTPQRFCRPWRRVDELQAYVIRIGRDGTILGLCR